MSNIIDKIQLSGITYDIGGQGGSGVSVVEVTQAEYDALPSSAKTDTSKMYVITDAQAGDLTNYYTKTETNSAITEATSGKVDSDVYTAYTAATDAALANKQTTLTAGTGIDITDNVISATGGGGGGKAIEAGRGISVNTGETADTISFSLPISAGTGGGLVFIDTTNNVGGVGCVSIGRYCSANGTRTFAQGLSTQSAGYNSHSEGEYTYAQGNNSHSEGFNVYAKNVNEHSQGKYNVSNKANNTWGDSGNTLFSVGNGTADDARHNAFEIRQNGDIYLTKDGQDVKLQDQLGGSSYTAGDGIDITNNVISVTGKVSTSDFNTYTAATDTTLASKQTTLTAGTNITIVDNVISATGGGGGGTVESAITSGSTNAVESKAIWSAVTYEVSINETLEFDNTYAATNYPSGCNSVTFENNTSGALPTGDYVFTSGGSEVAKLTCAVISWWPFEVGWTSSDPKLTYVVAEGNSAVTASYSELAGDVDGVTVPSAFTSASTATASGENHLWINENTYRKDEVYNKSEINVLSGIVDTKLDATAYTPTVCDSTLNMVSTNPVQNKALYDELRIDGGTALVFDENNFSTNYPNGCTRLIVEVVGSNTYSSIDFYDNDNKLGDIAVSYAGGIWITNNLEGATYERSGTTVIITYPTVTNVTKIQVTGTGNYAYKAVTTEATTALKDQVVANTTALGGLSLIKLTESEYAALVNKDANTLYVVTPDPNS